MVGFKTRIDMIYLEGLATEGLDMLVDLHRLEKDYGLHETYSFNKRFMAIEEYVTYLDDQMTGMILSLCAVICVVLFITVNWKVTVFVVISVILVDFYLVALIYFWGLTLNTVTGGNLIFAQGFAVDYSSHIAHAYLMTEPPASCVTNL